MEKGKKDVKRSSALSQKAAQGSAEFTLISICMCYKTRRLAYIIFSGECHSCSGGKFWQGYILFVASELCCV